jgi:GNAT superfamily N-acetyltransferase
LPEHSGFWVCLEEEKQSGGRINSFGIFRTRGACLNSNKVPNMRGIMYKKVDAEDGLSLLEFLCKLDACSKFMYYRPGERFQHVHDMRSHIKALRGNSAIFAHWEGNSINGYLALYGGRQWRVNHVAQLSCGVLGSVRRQGISTGLWEMAEEWCERVGIIRVELTVVGNNLSAYYCYLKWGFKTIGCREHSFKCDDGALINEIYMSKMVG